MLGGSYAHGGQDATGDETIVDEIDSCESALRLDRGGRQGRILLIDHELVAVETLLGLFDDLVAGPDHDRGALATVHGFSDVRPDEQRPLLRVVHVEIGREKVLLDPTRALRA